MAKRQSKKELSIEEKINQNPLYMKVCDSSSKCDAPRKLTDLGDMTANVCTQCLHILGWEKNKVEKEEKPKTNKPNSVAQKPQDKPAEIEEAKIVNDDDDFDEKIEKEADELKSTFAEIDKMAAESGMTKKEVEEATAGIDDDDDFDDDFDDEDSSQEGVFLIVDFNVVSTTEIALICQTENGKARFKVTTTTSADKVRTIEAKPQLVKGKGAKISYTGLDDKGRPMKTEYLAFAKFPQPA